MKLVKYEAARQALAEAHRIDEVKDIRDKAEAMAAYARQANDTAMVEWATEIKVRAERRCGELLKDTERNTGARGIGTSAVESCDRTPTLAQMGITKDQSSRYQKLADMPAEHFETAVETAKAQTGQVTSAFMLRTAQRNHPKTTKQAKQDRARIAELANSDYVENIIRRCIGVLDGASDELLEELADAVSAVRDGRALPA